MNLLKLGHTRNGPRLRIESKSDRYVVVRLRRKGHLTADDASCLYVRLKLMPRYGANLWKRVAEHRKRFPTPQHEVKLLHAMRANSGVQHNRMAAGQFRYPTRTHTGG